MSYFIPYEPTAKINYVYLLCLYKVAEYNKQTKCKDTITFNSIRDLSNRIKECTGIEIKQTTLYNFINRQSGNGYFNYDTATKSIYLQNNYNKNFYKNQTIKTFVILDEKHLSAIFEVKQQLFSKYLLYLVYFCGIRKKSDHTISQFLSATGYSANSSYVSQVSEYNCYLEQSNLISISRYRDKSGHVRNIYTII